MDVLLKIILVLATIFEMNWAQLKSCDNEKDQPKICSKGQTGFSEPFPVELNTTMYLDQIVGIDEDEKSISIQMSFISYWKDSRIDRSNRTERLAPSTLKNLISNLSVIKKS